MRYMIPLVLLLSLSGCKDNPPDGSPVNDGKSSNAVDSAISVDMTFERKIDLTVSDMAIVPNNVAPWAGSLFLLDDEHKLRRGDIESGEFDILANEITDLAPLARTNSPGILITRGKRGDIKAFIEHNDEGGYSEIALGETPNNIGSFCNTIQPKMNRIYAQSAQAIMALDLVSPKVNSYIGSALLENLQSGSELCNIAAIDEAVSILPAPKDALASVILSADTLLYTTKESLAAPRLFVKQHDKVMAVDIMGGLSTKPPKKIDAIYIIPNSLGGALRAGAVILADNETQRLIYISLDYFKQSLDEAGF